MPLQIGCINTPHESTVRPERDKALRGLGFEPCEDVVRPSTNFIYQRVFKFIYYKI